MAHYSLKIPIECGETTCYSVPGKHCKYLYTFKMGTRWTCHLFSETNSRGKPEDLEEKDGWLQRHPDCLALSVPTHTHSVSGHIDFSPYDAQQDPTDWDKLMKPLGTSNPTTKGSITTDSGSVVQVRTIMISNVPVHFCFIPPGEFLMGSPDSEEGRAPEEKQHEVVITKGYWLADTPCTWELWRAVMSNDRDRSVSLQHPVTNVSWDDCMKFIQKVNEQVSGLEVRLPTEAEWEYACRAGTETRYYSGNEEKDLAQAGWYIKNSGERLHKTGKKKPNQFGLYDMHGNIWEWCSDWYGEYDEGKMIDPQGPKEGVSRVLRGGSWILDARYCRSADRYWNHPGGRNHGYGFRLVLNSV